jgi:hypothetical protein
MSACMCTLMNIICNCIVAFNSLSWLRRAIALNENCLRCPISCIAECWIGRMWRLCREMYLTPFIVRRLLVIIFMSPSVFMWMRMQEKGRSPSTERLLHLIPNVYLYIFIHNHNAARPRCNITWVVRAGVLLMRVYTCTLTHIRRAFWLKIAACSGTPPAFLIGERCVRC